MPCFDFIKSNKPKEKKKSENEVSAIYKYLHRCWKPIQIIFIINGVDINASFDMKKFKRNKNPIFLLFKGMLFVLFTLSVVQRTKIMIDHIIPAIGKDAIAFFRVAMYSVTLNSYVTYLLLLSRQRNISEFINQLFMHLSVPESRVEIQAFGRKWFRIIVIFLIWLVSVLDGAFFIKLHQMLEYNNAISQMEMDNTTKPLLATDVYNTLVDNIVFTMILELFTSNLFFYSLIMNFMFVWVCSMLYTAINNIKLPTWPSTNQTLNDVDLELKSFMFQHRKVCVLVRRANHVFGFLNLVWVCSDIFILVFVISVIKVTEKTISQNVPITIFLFVLLLFFRNFYGSRVNAAIFDIFGSIKAIDSFGDISAAKYHSPTEIQMEFQEYCTGLLISKPNLSLWGLFAFKKRLIVSIAGTLITYSLIFYTI